eukprot:jgi/Psemu1/2468/gm1.2468_g
MPPSAAAGRGRKAGIGNYTRAELVNMFAAIRAVMPAGTDDWDDVTDLHAEKFPGRDEGANRQSEHEMGY